MLALLSIACSLAASPELRLAHREQRALERVIEREIQTEVSEVFVRAQGSEKIVQSPGLKSTDRSRMVVVDRYQTVLDGQALSFERLFQACERDLRETTADKQGKLVERSVHQVAPLVGYRARFQRDSLTEPFRIRWHEDQGPKDDLPRLDADMDAAALLPEESVSSGARWKVAAKHFQRAVLSPGGRPRMLAAESEQPTLEERLADAVWNSFQGELKAHYVERTQTSGGWIARIEVEGRLEFDAQAERLAQETGPNSLRRYGTLDAKVVLLWSLDQGRAHELQVELDYDMRLLERSMFTPKGAEPFPMERELVINQREQARLTVKDAAPR
jgi:hypothetical protein